MLRLQAEAVSAAISAMIEPISTIRPPSPALIICLAATFAVWCTLNWVVASVRIVVSQGLTPATRHTRPVSAIAA